MILFILSFLFASPHRMQVHGQQMLEWAPIVYDLDSRSLIVDDFICDPWLPQSPLDQEKALKVGFPAIYFKKTGRFYLLRQLIYYPETKLWIVDPFDSLQCNQITIFKDGFE